MFKNRELSKANIQKVLRDHCKNGDTYLLCQELFQRCMENDLSLTKEAFIEDLQELVQQNFLHEEQDRIYLYPMWLYESEAACAISETMTLPPFPPTALPPVVKANNVTLCGEQRKAVEMALSNRLSLVLGGAGTGKTSIISAIVEYAEIIPGRLLLCAPTGKAAQNLIERTGYSAMTIHRAMSKKRKGDYVVSEVAWEELQLVIIDEVSMMTMELLAKVLCRVKEDCRIVMLGDEQQLPAIGAGNVIADLLAIGVPHVELKENHRQSEDAYCLNSNVIHFDEICRKEDLLCGESFSIESNQLGEDAMERLAEDASRMLLNKQPVQVVASHNGTAEMLNQLIRERVNPQGRGKKEIRVGKRIFRDGDQVILTKNDYDHRCYNGDMGTLHIHENAEDLQAVSVTVTHSKRVIVWEGEAVNRALEQMQLAYAITIHRSQGSEYDTVLMPIAPWMHGMLNRNLFYTAISRAKKRMVIYGDPAAVDMALAKSLPPRRTMLVTKTQNAIAYELKLQKKPS